MIDKIRALKAEAEDIRERSRKLNMKLSELNGVTATIPNAGCYPLKAFRGTRVILHNVSFDINGELYAVITIPHRGSDQSYLYRRLYIDGHKIRVNINENWFINETSKGKGYNG